VYTGSATVYASDYNYGIVRDPDSVWDMRNYSGSGDALRNFYIGTAGGANTSCTGNSLLVENHGALTNVNILYVGYHATAVTPGVAVSNSLTAASGGTVTATTIEVGRTVRPRDIGNRLITAGGKITADTITVAFTNGIGAVLGDYEPVPIEATLAATLGDCTYVYPDFVKGSAAIGGVIFQAPTITGYEHVILDPNADDQIWRLKSTETTISLWHRNLTTMMIVR